MIKSLILTLLMLLLVSLNGTNNTIAMNSISKLRDVYYYRDLGSYHQNYSDGSSIHIDAYIVKKYNRTGAYTNYRYQYELTLKSQSIHNGYYTETWLYGVKFYYNNQEISYNQYPNGATLYIDTVPTGVYSWFTSDEEIGKFMIFWNSAVYEPR